jgi:hypothetical protein
MLPSPMLRTRAPLLALALALVACGGAVSLDPGGAGGAGGADAASTSATTTTSSSAPTTGTGAGGAPSCELSSDGFQMELESWDGSVWGCSDAAGPTGDYTLEGALTRLSDKDFEIDSCPPDADCAPQISRLHVSAPGLYPTLFDGAAVRISVHVERPWGCEHHVSIWNLASWGGTQNPFLPFHVLLLAAGDGTIDTIPETELAIDKVPVDCPRPGPGSIDVYALRFHDPSGSDEGVVVGMQDPPATIYRVETCGYWVVDDLRSYETNVPDDSWNWGYWAFWSEAIT